MTVTNLFVINIDPFLQLVCQPGLLINAAGRRRHPHGLQVQWCLNKHI